MRQQAQEGVRIYDLQNKLKNNGISQTFENDTPNAKITISKLEAVKVISINEDKIFFRLKIEAAHIKTRKANNPVKTRLKNN